MLKFIRKLIILSPVMAQSRPNDDIADHWTESTKLVAKMGITNRRRQKKVSFDGEYLEFAGKATQHYATFVPDGFVSKKGRSAADIRSTYARNMEASYQKWETNTSRAYQTQDGVPAKLYQERVDAAKENYRKGGEKSLRLNGTRNGELGVVPLAVHYLAGESLRHLPMGVDGAPYNIARYRLRGNFKSSLECRLTQGGALIINQNCSAEAVEEENKLNTVLLNGLRDPAKCDEFVNTPDPDKCFCLWEMGEEGLLYLHLQVGKTM